MKLNEVRREDFIQWKSQDVTQAYMEFIEDTIKELTVDLSEGLTLQDPASVAVKTAQAVGVLQGLKFTLAVRIQDEEISPGD